MTLDVHAIDGGGGAVLVAGRESGWMRFGVRLDQDAILKEDVVKGGGGLRTRFFVTKRNRHTAQNVSRETINSHSQLPDHKPLRARAQRSLLRHGVCHSHASRPPAQRVLQIASRSDPSHAARAWHALGWTAIVIDQSNFVVRRRNAACQQPSQPVSPSNQPANQPPALRHLKHLICKLRRPPDASRHADPARHRISFFCLTNQWAGRSAAVQLPI
ncbi:uncharacterized protein IWZ02DRAFT_45948 [Phyllosticta citriasiana]|uniref:uncharacterized protein n=1 Tax=Phyllosticta citriasiana TaxID=595635 RepID=UPI0030FDE10D